MAGEIDSEFAGTQIPHRCAAAFGCLRRYAPFELGSSNRVLRTCQIRKALQLEGLSNLARPERFELPTNWFEASYSIQLSYGRVDYGLYLPLFEPSPISGNTDPRGLS